MLQATRSAKTALWPTLAAGLAMLATSAHAESPVAPDGYWFTKGDESIIKVHPCPEAGLYCGTLVWLKDPNESDGTAKLDKLNKDPVKRMKPLVGVEILLAMKAVEDHWKGKAYNAEDGKIYDITFKVNDDKADLRGCVLGFLCQTETFTRTDNVPGGDPSATATVADSKKHKGKVSAHK